MRHGFPKERRIKNRETIRRILHLGQKAVDGFVRLYAAPGGTVRGLSRCGILVSRRNGTAVARNRIKRLCREAFRLVSGAIPPGYDYLVCPHPGKEPGLDELGESLKNLAASAVLRVETEEGRKT